MELKGTKTEQNLMTAFAGESQARNKYTYFASKAKKEGYEQIAALFEETAANEKEHAKIWFKLLCGGDIGTTEENLKDAAAGETHEERYLKLLQNVEDGSVFAKNTKSVWICRNCGHIVDSLDAPEVCPVCKHPQAYFELRVINY